MSEHININLIKKIINDGEAVIEPIEIGQHGDKYCVTSHNDKFFCRIFKIRTSCRKFRNQEPEILNQVESPYVVKPIHSLIKQGRHILITEFKSGKNLGEILKKGPLPSQKVIQLAKNLLSAVAAIERAGPSPGAAHLDIKPENIIVGENDYFLVDFGAARFLKSLERGERIFPARRFIAPEVLSYLFDPTDANMLAINIRSDIYSIGGVLYSAITGHPLSEFFKTSSDILRKNVPPIQKEIEPWFAKLIYEMLEKRPSYRPDPDTALSSLNSKGEEKVLSQKNLPIFLLKKEYTTMLAPLSAQQGETGILWASGSPPIIKNLKKKTPFIPIFWEMSPDKFFLNIKQSILKQWEFNAAVVCIPTQELSSPLNEKILKENIEVIEKSLDIKKQLSFNRKAIAIIQIDENLLLSEGDRINIQDAFIRPKVDGVIFRIYGQNVQSYCDERHLAAVEDFIKPWVRSSGDVYFDGDLSVIPLMLCGVTGFVATAYPKMPVSPIRRIAPSFAKRPDGMFIPKLLMIVHTDSVLGLQNRAETKSLINCSCPACVRTLMKEDKKQNWKRPERREHFIYSITQELKEIRKRPPLFLGERIKEALVEADRISKFVTLPSRQQLRNWEKFLKNSFNIIR